MNDPLAPTVIDLEEDRKKIDPLMPDYTETNAQIRGNLAVTRDMNPDMEARAIRLSKDLGIPWSLARGNEDKLEKVKAGPDLKKL